MSKESFRLLCDVRETNRIAAFYPYREHIEIVVEQLPVGDFIVSPDVGIEVKGKFERGHDFVLSLIDGRLEDECRRLSASFKFPILIVEDFDYIYQSNLHPDALAGMISKLVMNYRIIILPSLGKAGTARLIAAFVRRVQKSPKDLPLRVNRPKFSSPEDYRATCIQSAYIHVGPETAAKLLAHYKIPARIHEDFVKATRNLVMNGEKVSYIEKTTCWETTVPAKYTYLNGILWGILDGK